MSEAIRDKAGYLRQCEHAEGVVTMCARCLMREADLVGARAGKSVDVEASVAKACAALQRTQAEVARLMGLTPQQLGDMKRGERAMPKSALKWLESKECLVFRRARQA